MATVHIIGAIKDSQYARDNPSYPVYSWEDGRKAGGKKLVSADGHQYNFKDTSAKSTINICECVCRRSRGKRCEKVVSVHPGGMVVDRVIHHCQSKQYGRSHDRQSEDAGYGSNSSNSVPPDNGSVEESSEALIPKFCIHPDDQFTILLGNPAYFSAQATGKNVEYQWKHDEKDVTDNGRVTGSKNECLTINETRIEDEGRYECVASNVHGKSKSIPALLCLIVLPGQQTEVMQSSGLGSIVDNYPLGNSEVENRKHHVTMLSEIAPTEAMDNCVNSELVTGCSHIADIMSTETVVIPVEHSAISSVGFQLSQLTIKPFISLAGDNHL